MKDTDLLKIAKIYYENSLCADCDMKGQDRTPNAYCSYEQCAERLKEVLEVQNAGQV